MSLRRFNELRGEEVVYAVQRQDRTFLPAEDHCPLCPTRPGQPPTEIPFPVSSQMGPQLVHIASITSRAGARAILPAVAEVRIVGVLAIGFTAKDSLQTWLMKNSGARFHPQEHLVRADCEGNDYGNSPHSSPHE